MNLARQLKDPEMLLDALMSLLFVSVMISDFKSAKIFCEKALMLAKNSDQKSIFKLWRKIWNSLSQN
ncbi:MAG: hypothetical protein JW891_12765 [Candidatus Lokiarchaeota archaeon]|nr:hypothetical protein [Candidatus Lokiarchaeota archaeon]